MKIRSMKAAAVMLLALLLLFTMTAAATAEGEPCTQHVRTTQVIDEPTCTEYGYYIGVCAICGERLDNGDVIPPLGHNYQDTVFEQPTCYSDGWGAEICANCGEWKDDGYAIPALGHDFQETIVRQPTCTEVGWAVEICSRCGESKDNGHEIPALGHAWDGGSVTAAATCTTDGVITYTCTRCGVTATEPISARGHVPVTVPGKAATCTAGGLTDGSICSVCGAILTDQAATAPLGHDYQLTASKEATATEDGYRTYTCSRCGDSYTETISKVPHDHAFAVVSETPATCTTDGSRTYACTICGAAYSETIPAFGHNWGDWFVVKGATATEDGLAQRTCKNDASHVEYYTIPATGETGTDEEEKKEDNGLHPALSVKTSAEPDAGKGKRYKGALVLIHYETTNTGNCPLYVFYWGDSGPLSNVHDIINPNGTSYVDGMNNGFRVALLNPGETYSFNKDQKVWTCDVDRGYLEMGAYEEAWYYDENGDIQHIEAHGDKWNLPLTYPEGVTPEPDKPGLTLTWTGDEYRKGGKGSLIPTTQDTFDANDDVIAFHTLVNSGNVPLVIILYCKDEGLHDWLMLPWSLHSIDPGESFNDYIGDEPLEDYITPGTDTEDLLGTATLSFYYVGYDPDTFVDVNNPGTELCRSETVTRTWKARRPGTDLEEWEIPELSKLQLSIEEVSDRADPAGYQLDEFWDTWIHIDNIGPVDVDDYTLHVDNITSVDYLYPYLGTSYDVSHSEFFDPGEALEAGQSENKLISYFYMSPCAIITADDVARGYVQISAYVTWTDPDSGNPKKSSTASITLPVISKTGLLVKKGIEHGPANESWFQEGEAIPWTLTVTNNSKEPISNVTVTDEGAVVGTFAVINAGETVECTVPAHTVTEYEAKVSGHVSNQAFATGTDVNGVEHTWPSNPADVPTSSWSPVPPTIFVPGKTGDPGPGSPVPGPGSPVPGPGSPLPPGTPETPETPGTPGGGPDPVGELLGVKVSTSVYKTTAHLPKNYDYYEEGEQADYKVTIKNTGETALENVKVYDSLHGLTPVETIPSLAPNEEKTVSFSYIVTKDDVEKRGYVVNQVTIYYDFLSLHGTPQKSNPVYIIAGKNGHLPGDITGGGITIGHISGGTDSGDPLHPWFSGLTGLYTGGGTGGANCCSLTLNAMGTTESLNTLHACADHSEAAKKAEAASPTEAAAIWREEISKLYDTLYETSAAEGQAAVINDKIAFEAYADAYGALYGDEALRDLLRLRCAELCCMIHTAPDALPDSLLGSYAAMLSGGTYDLSERIIGALKGSDSNVTVHMNGLLADAMAETKEILYGTKLYAADESFGQARNTWQRALDKAVNAKYKAADQDGKKALAAWRQALDQMYAARKELLELLYSGNDETAQECLMNLYRDASIDATGTN